MGIYSPYNVYPSYFDEEFDCKEEFCDICTFDCNKKEHGVDG